MAEVQHIERGGRPRLAYRLREGEGPVLIFLPGYMSDMEGGKATSLDTWAAIEGRAMLRFDYAGTGISEGAFEDQSLDDWLADVLLMIDEVAEGPVLLVGSSMGGWLMLLAALARPRRVVGLVGIASAPDFTEWDMDKDDRRTLRKEGRLERDNDYGDEPQVTTLRFFESAQTHLLLDGEVEIDCPVRLLHGQADTDVPWEISLKLASALRSYDVQLTLVKDGDHRLSRAADIALLIDTVARHPALSPAHPVEDR